MRRKCHAESICNRVAVTPLSDAFSMTIRRIFKKIKILYNLYRFLLTICQRQKPLRLEQRKTKLEAKLDIDNRT